MNDAWLYSLLADTLLVIHFTFVVFVVAGFLLILLGKAGGEPDATLLSRVREAMRKALDP